MQKIFGLAGLVLLVSAFLVPGGPDRYTNGWMFFAGLAVLIIAWLGPPSVSVAYATARPARTETEGKDWYR